MADVGVVGTTVTDTSSTDPDNVAVTIDAAADAVVVICSGWNGNGNYNLDVLNFDNGGTFDFTQVELCDYESNGVYTTCSAYIMTSSSADWPGTGSATLYWSIDGSAVNGMCLVIFQVENNDTSTPIVDSAPAHNADITNNTTHTFSAMTGVGSEDLGIVGGHDVGSTINLVPSGAGQTLIAETSAFNTAVAAAAYELGEDAMQGFVDDGGLVQFAIKAAAGGGGPTIPAGSLALLGVGT